jgi:hypothetical protein
MEKEVARTTNLKLILVILVWFIIPLRSTSRNEFVPTRYSRCLGWVHREGQHTQQQVSARRQQKPQVNELFYNSHSPSATENVCIDVSLQVFHFLRNATGPVKSGTLARRGADLDSLSFIFDGYGVD